MKNHKEEIGVFFLFLILFLAIILNTNLNSMDEIWVFNTARNVANGLLPYKDFNLITTPGICIICGFILKIFGTELIVMRVICCILGAAIFVSIYKIINLFKINKYTILLILLLFYSNIVNYIEIDYNFVILLISLIVLYFELKLYIESNDIFNYTFKRNFFLGIVVGLSICFKQTTGLLLIICFIFYKILAVRNIDELKKFLKIAITRFLGICIPIIALVIYLYVNNLIKEFIDYTILGVLEFSNKVSYLNLLIGEFGIFALLLPIIIVIAFYKGVIKNDRMLLILFSYSLATFCGIYPIADTYHFITSGTIALIITGVYFSNKIYRDIFSNCIVKQDENNKKILKILTLTLLSTFVVAAIAGIIYFMINCKDYTDLKNLKYIVVTEDVYGKIAEIDSYIESQEDEVLIIDATASMYMVTLDKYNKDYDMLLKGNLGENGSEKLIADLELKENVKLLILTDLNSLNWQTPLDVIQYVLDNYTKTGKIGDFSIYEKE